MNFHDMLRKNLTAAQYAAAADPSRAVLCLACAGSGKSRTLAYRMARLIVEGADPAGLVAFTFTKKAAASIQQRVSEALTASGVEPTSLAGMYIGTIHGYCKHVLGVLDAEYRQFDVLDENRFILYLMAQYAQLGLEVLRPRGQGFFDVITKVAAAWHTAHNELLTFHDISSHDSELGVILEHLQENLKSDRFLDFSLMIRSVVDALRTKNSNAAKPFSSLSHLMVDEYQDINPGQAELIRLLAGHVETLFVVGDDDQAIYAWRGADVSHIQDFAHEHRVTNVHILEQNFRSTKAIVQASSHFASVFLSERLPKEPRAATDRYPQDCRVCWFLDRNTEAGWVAQCVKDLLGIAYTEHNEGRRGLTPADFAILMRSTRVPERNGIPRHSPFTTALTKLGIPFSLEAGGDPFESPYLELLRSTLEHLREECLDDERIQKHFSNKVIPVFSAASYPDLVRVLEGWNQRIHRSRTGNRLRIYPQQLFYDLLLAFNLAQAPISDEAMRSIGLFSQMLEDVETSYGHIESPERFSQVLNFLGQHAVRGYDVISGEGDQVDAVTVATVHKVKGLEFPCVFVVDTENRRFPGIQRPYEGLLPHEVLQPALERGAYQNTTVGEARLFYTAVTRAERYLYVSGSAQLPGASRQQQPSRFTQDLASQVVVNEGSENIPSGSKRIQPRRRDRDDSTNISLNAVQSYLQCPQIYQLRERHGFRPVISAMFGFGKTVRTAIQKLHDRYPSNLPSPSQVEEVVKATFHLRHIPPSSNPFNRPGGFERARDRAVAMVQSYAQAFGSDFQRPHQSGTTFSIAVADSVVSGSIDLTLLTADDQELEIVNFKALENSTQTNGSVDLVRPASALQVQINSQVEVRRLGKPIQTGYVHFLPNSQRVAMPTNANSFEAAFENVTWAVDRIRTGDFPMRPHPDKCANCDFQSVCPQRLQEFRTNTKPPPLHLDEEYCQMAPAFSVLQGMH